MKIFTQYGLFVLISLLLGGCCMLECIGPLSPSQPYGAHWIKEGMTKDSRLDDTVACGSGRTEYVLFSDLEIQAAKQPEDPNDIRAYLRLRDKWAGCMRDKGYIYLENCDARCQWEVGDTTR